ncbi:MAG TPA: response regulator [Vicinamibacterales bacterium]|nr:response regulator [Vicinamibacterales bacterium]
MPYNLLLADDSVTIQRVIELTFADEDIQVTAVSDGEQAIQRLETAPPDIVLADIGMPGRNGYEVARFIKQSPRLAHIPVVLLTGAFEPVDQARAAEAGCDGVLAKPFEPQLVIGRVKELLARRRPAAAGATGASAVPSSASPQEQWAPPPIPATAPSAPAISLDSYFDRLDAAFTNVSAAPATTPGPPTPAPPAPPVTDEIDWFGAAKTETPAPSPDLELPAPPAMDERPDLPLTGFAATVPEPETAVRAPAIAPDEPPAPVTETPHVAIPATAASPVPVAAAPSPAAEVPVPAADAPVVQAGVQPGVVTAAQPLVPIHQIPTLADAFAVLLAAEKGEVIPSWPADDIVEQVTKRILAQLSERIVRETVADVVNAVAERMIREEIDRIKSAIQ